MKLMQNYLKSQQQRKITNRDFNKQLLDKVFVTSAIIKVEADKTCRDLDYSWYHKNWI